MRYFLYVAISVLILGSLYVGLRVFSPLAKRRRMKLAMWLGIAFLMFLQIKGPSLYRSGGEPTETMRAFQIIVYTLLGAFSLVFFGAIAWDLLTYLPRRKFSAERRALFTKAGAYGVLGFAGSASVAGYFQARRIPGVKASKVPVANLPKALQGFRIAQLSDVHIGPTLGPDYLRALVDTVNALNVDLVALTGDIVDGTVAQLSSDMSALSDLQAKHGTFYVSGNHEYYWNAVEWAAFMTEKKIKVLENEHFVIPLEGANLLVGGVTDLRAYQFFPDKASSPERAIANAPQCDFKLLLAHQPGSCEAAVKAGFNLQLSGHTHGGQYYPWRFFVQMAHKYLEGLHNHQGMWVYVSRGAGYWGPPNRFGVPGEITLLELTAAT